MQSCKSKGLHWPFLCFSGGLLWMQCGIPVRVRSGRHTACSLILHTHSKFVTLWLNSIEYHSVKGKSIMLSRNRCYGLLPLMTALQIDQWRTSLRHLLLLSLHLLINYMHEATWKNKWLWIFVHSKHYATRTKIPYFIWQRSPILGRVEMQPWASRSWHNSTILVMVQSIKCNNKPTSHSFCSIRLIVLIHQVHMCYLHKQVNKSLSHHLTPQLAFTCKNWQKKIKKNDNYHLTIATLKWMLGAQDNQDLPLLAASSYDKECSHGWQILATLPWAPHSVRKTETCHTVEIGERGGKGLPGWWAATLNCKTPEETPSMLNSTIHEHVEIQHMHSCVDTVHYQGTWALFVVNSIKLHLRWFLRNKSYWWIFLKLSLNVLFQALFWRIQ